MIGWWWALIRVCIGPVVINMWWAELPLFSLLEEVPQPKGRRKEGGDGVLMKRTSRRDRARVNNSRCVSDELWVSSGVSGYSGSGIS